MPFITDVTCWPYEEGRDPENLLLEKTDIVKLKKICFVVCNLLGTIVLVFLQLSVAEFSRGFSSQKLYLLSLSKDGSNLALTEQSDQH